MFIHIGKMNSAVYAGEEDLHNLTSFRGIDIVHRPKMLLYGRQVPQPYTLNPKSIHTHAHTHTHT